MPATATVRSKAKVTLNKPAPRSRTIKQQCSDEAVRRATGKDWGQWTKILDARGAADMPHKQIAEMLHDDLGVGDWWAQMVTVGYEQARGLRRVGETCKGDFKISATKIVDVPVDRLFSAFADDKLRRKWLGDHDWTIRKSTRPKSLRITWEDGKTSLNVNLYPKGAGKSSAQIEHAKLPDEKAAAKWKKFWRGKVEDLKSVLEAL
jgi:uncharacterized protein YndB with AHSA1/START domain